MELEYNVEGKKDKVWFADTNLLSLFSEEALLYFLLQEALLSLFSAKNFVNVSKSVLNSKTFSPSISILKNNFTTLFMMFCLEIHEIQFAIEIQFVGPPKSYNFYFLHIQHPLVNKKMYALFAYVIN